MLAQYLTNTVALYGIPIVGILVFLSSHWTQQLPGSIPWVGGHTSTISRFVAPWLSLFRGRKYLEEAYYKYGKHEQLCIVPGFFDSHVVIPPSWISWLVAQPETSLSAKAAQVDAIEGRYTMLKPAVAEKPAHETIIKKELKAQLGELTPVMADEVDCALRDVWGTDEQNFRSVDLDVTIRTVICRVANRTFVGLPLCRNETFVSNAIRFVDDIGTIGLILKALPLGLRPVAGRLLTLINRWHYSKCAPFATSFFAQRLEAHYSTKTAKSLPNDFAMWAVRDALGRGDEAEKTPDMLSRRLLTLNFAAIHTSTMTTVNLMLDIFSARRCTGSASTENTSDSTSYIDLLRRESQNAENSYGSSWPRARALGLFYLDAALRESMRLSGFGGKAFTRKVISPAGVRLPDGTHVSHGVLVSVSGYGLHHDAEIYPDPYAFNPGRFAGATKRAFDENFVGTDAAQAKPAATTEPNFAVWGHGLHACPGRFFAVDLVKIVLSHVLLRYEVRPLSERPAHWWIGDNPIPPRNLRIGVRRKS